MSWEPEWLWLLGVPLHFCDACNNLELGLINEGIKQQQQQHLKSLILPYTTKVNKNYLTGLNTYFVVQDDTNEEVEFLPNHSAMRLEGKLLEVWLNLSDL